MIKLLTIIGARPQIIKAAALSRAIREGFSDSLSEVILHTGQHYDENMSQVFFDEMGIPRPDYNLNAGSGLHGAQTALMISGIEEVLLREKPDMVVVYGDTNSTLAAAIAASKLHIPLAHIEAGLRSFNKSMPEEVNRILCDHVSTLLFTPTVAGLKNLQREGFNPDAMPPFNADNPKVYHCGDVMLDNSLHFSSLAESKSAIITDSGLENTPYVLVTIHRDHNTDNPERLGSILQALLDIAAKDNIRLVVPLHPRTRKMIDRREGGFPHFLSHPSVLCLPPASFFEMLLLEKHSTMIITDSGGVQKESYFFKKPCIILRPQTEWVEIVEQGTAIVADASPERIKNAYTSLKDMKNHPFPPVFGEGNAAEFICSRIVEFFTSR
jgi:UDP-GlcNAc3NAcA epimerase